MPQALLVTRLRARGCSKFEPDVMAVLRQPRK
jgi:hypothetical protein